MQLIRLSHQEGIELLVFRNGDVVEKFFFLSITSQKNRQVVPKRLAMMMVLEVSHRKDMLFLKDAL